MIESHLEGAKTNLSYSLNGFEGQNFDIPIKIMKSHDKIFVFVPGELFSELVNPYKDENIYFICYTNGYIGYLADEYAYQNQFYEAMFSPFEKGEGELLMKFIISKISTDFN